MKIEKISIGNFKVLYNTVFEPGRVNVFIGANGAGKSTILEAIGILSVAMSDRVDENNLKRKGVRLSVPGLYKSRFKNLSRVPLTIDLAVQWQDQEERYEYDVHLTPPKDSGYWKYHSEVLECSGKQKWGRSNASRKMLNNNVGFLQIDDSPELTGGRNMAREISAYGIFQPDTLTLRGTVPDTNQMSPIGLNGGRLAEALQDIISEKDGEICLGTLYMDEVLELIDWAADISIDAPKKSSINSNIPAMRQIIEFSDRFLKDTVKFTGYDASEGALYVLFMLCLAMHPQAPAIFAVDSFDHALNPRLAKRLTKVFSRLVLENDRHVFLTTHNPLVLDGLDLSNDDIRLFAVDRDKYGYTQIKRIQVSEELIREGQPLSRLWINGRLGGVPELI